MVKATAGEQKKPNGRFFVHCAIGLAVMFGFQYLPVVAPLTPLGMNGVLGTMLMPIIFALAACCYIFLGLPIANRLF